ncbi:MAG: septum formation initiator family protein [Candidatus Moranbacteria bacterium]|nr:septum formation initiator family protein [Candidatus Moranbacteria bacterium]
MVARRYLIRGGVVLMVALISWVAFLSSKQFSRNGRIENEVRLLQNEADKIRRENETLSEKISYFSSDNFREQEAKEKLGMKKVDEAVVVIQARPERETMAMEETPKRAAPEVTGFYPNYKRWWQVFFGASTE